MGDEKFAKNKNHLCCKKRHNFKIMILLACLSYHYITEHAEAFFAHSVIHMTFTFHYICKTQHSV